MCTVLRSCTLCNQLALRPDAYKVYTDLRKQSILNSFECLQIQIVPICTIIKTRATRSQAADMIKAICHGISWTVLIVYLTLSRRSAYTFCKIIAIQTQNSEKKYNYVKVYATTISKIFAGWFLKNNLTLMRNELNIIY